MQFNESVEQMLQISSRRGRGTQLNHMHEGTAITDSFAPPVPPGYQPLLPTSIERVHTGKNSKDSSQSDQPAAGIL